MVYHILKDGTVTNDISGKIVKVKDAVALYELITKINQERGTTKEKGVKYAG